MHSSFLCLIFVSVSLLSFDFALHVKYNYKCVFVLYTCWPKNLGWLCPQQQYSIHCCAFFSFICLLLLLVLVLASLLIFLIISPPPPPPPLPATLSSFVTKWGVGWLPGIVFICLEVWGWWGYYAAQARRSALFVLENRSRLKEWMNNCWWGWQNRTALAKCTQLFDDTQGTIKDKRFQQRVFVGCNKRDRK